jgi:uncharacterized repeat protein (TIGR01451 family)
MNYSFQFGIPPSDPDGGMGPLTGKSDYSRSALATLNEGTLNETAGIGDGTDQTVFFCPGGAPTLGAGNAAIDWNCNGSCTPTVPCEPSVSVDVNGDGPQGALPGFDDWQNLRYDFQGTSSFDDGFHPDSPPEPEVDFRMYTEMLAPELTLEKTGAPDPVASGQNVTYAVTLRNVAPSGASGVRVSDALPAALTFVSCAATGGGACGGSGNARTVDFPSFGGGTTATITLVGRVPCDTPDGTVLANTATVATDSVEQEPTNDAATASVTVSNPPFQRIDCHLDELAALLPAAPGLGTAGPGLSRLIATATRHKKRAEALAAAGRVGAAKRYLKHAIRRMISFNHRMRSLDSRHEIPDATRAAILAMSQPIQDAMQTLLDTL